MARDLEHCEQVAVINWADAMAGQVPELGLLYAVPNAGKRTPRERGRLLDEGLRSGVPDLALPVARGGYNALFIEMKAGRNVSTDNQIAWQGRLREHGNRVEVCYSFEEARAVLEDYLGIAGRGRSIPALEALRRERA